MIPIEKMEVGAEPAEFELARTGRAGPGRWTVILDATASGGRAIEQSSTEQTDYRFPLAVYKSISAKNVEVSLRFKPVVGVVDRAGGIALRLSSPDNYYLVRANALEDNVRFYRVVNGRREQIEGANTKVSANEWHILSLKAEGERFTVTLMASNCTPRATKPSQTQASRFGPRQIVSRVSTVLRSRRYPNQSGPHGLSAPD